MTDRVALTLVLQPIWHHVIVICISIINFSKGTLHVEEWWIDFL